MESNQKKSLPNVTSKNRGQSSASSFPLTCSPLSKEATPEVDQEQETSRGKPPIKPTPGIYIYNFNQNVRPEQMERGLSGSETLTLANLRGGLRLSSAQLSRVDSVSNQASRSEGLDNANDDSDKSVAEDFRSPPVNILSTSDPYYNYFTDKSIALQDGTYWAQSVVDTNAAQKHRLGSSERDLNERILRDSLHELSMASKLADVLGAPATSEAMANPRQQSLENGLAKELQDIFAALERCIELRSAYMHASRQCPGGTIIFQ